MEILQTQATCILALLFQGQTIRTQAREIHTVQTQTVSVLTAFIHSG